MSDFEYVFEDVTGDVDTELSVEGQVPAGLSGTFYAAGGTGTKVGNRRVHGFDAHGRVTAVRIANGGARLRARMVETPLLQAERAAGAIVKRRLFTNKPSRWSNLFDVDLGNNAWHNVVRWGDHAVALNDPGFFLLDPETLKTIGPAPLAPAKGAVFTPMPRRDPRTGRMIFFEKRPGRRDTVVVREVDDAFRVQAEMSYTLPSGAMLLHDVGFTERFYLVAQWGALALPRLLWGAHTVAESITFDARKTPTLYLLPRAGGAAIPVPLPGGRLHFHFWNAFEDSGSVVLDAIGYDGAVSFTSLYPPSQRAAGFTVKKTPAGGTYRYTVDPATRSVRSERLGDASEAPCIREDRRGRAYRFGWGPVPGTAGDEEDRMAFAWFHAMARHDFEQRKAEVWDAGPRAFVSPAAFTPRPGDAEDDGWILAWIQDTASRRASVGIFDAKNVAAGPVARLVAPELVGMISHVSFAA